MHQSKCVQAESMELKINSIMDALTITDQKFPKQIFLGMPPHTFGSCFNGHFMVRLTSISNFNFNFNFS